MRYSFSIYVEGEGNINRYIEGRVIDGVIGKVIGRVIGGLSTRLSRKVRKI